MPNIAGSLRHLAAVTNRSAHDAAENVTTAFVRRHHTVGHQEGSCARVIGNDAKGCDAFQDFGAVFAFDFRVFRVKRASFSSSRSFCKSQPAIFASCSMIGMKTSVLKLL